jgi:predicted ribosomally synthesized peptide with SipW-like signal peptide
MSKKRVKQYLMLLTVIGLVSIASGSGTFASFSAQTTNSGNTFAAGTLFLHNVANGGTTCTSESQTTGNFNIDPTGCGVLFTADLSQGSTTAHLALSNAGSLDSTDLLAAVPTCAWSKNSGGSPTFISPLPADCSGVNVTIQETTTSSYAVDKYCAYGPSINAGVDCTTPDNTATLEALKTASQQLLTTAAAPTTLVAGATRYYVITVDPSGVGTGNALQNLKLTFDMSWHIDQ